MASLRTWFQAVQPRSFIASLVGVAVGIFYTLPPFALQYHGVGEVAVAFVFGPIVVLGAYAVQVGALAWEPFLASIPLGLLVAAFLLVNEMPEHVTDPRGGKRTVPARIGLEKSVTLYEILVGSALVLLAVLAASRLISWVALIGLIASIPLARARSVLRVHYREYPAHIPANAGTIQAVLVLVPVGEVSRERDGGRKESEDDRGERALAKSGAAECDGGSDRHDRPERQERRQFADPAVAELEGR